MPCDTKLKPQQTPKERAAEVQRAVTGLDLALRMGGVKVVIGPQGAIAFAGWDSRNRDGVTDNCAYRRIMATGSSMAKMAIARAEQLSGRTINKQVIGQGVHSHDGGATWHNKG